MHAAITVTTPAVRLPHAHQIDLSVARFLMTQLATAGITTSVRATAAYLGSCMTDAIPAVAWPVPIPSITSVSRAGLGDRTHARSGGDRQMAIAAQNEILHC
jgi:hypothetical protein